MPDACLQNKTKRMTSLHPVQSLQFPLLLLLLFGEATGLYGYPYLHPHERSTVDASIRDHIFRLERARPGYGEPVLDSPVSYRNHPFSRNLQSRRDQFENIRIALDTSTLRKDGNSTSNAEKIAWLESEIFPAAAEFWHQALSVIPVEGNLLVNQNQLFNGEVCGLPEVIVPVEHMEEGVSGADILVYVAGSDNPNYCGGLRLAVALLCNTDAFDRPTAGSMNVCLGEIPETFEGRDARADEYIQTLIHEFSHILGMSSNSYVLFHDHATGRPRTPRPLQQTTVDCVNGNMQEEYLPASNTLELFTHPNTGQRTAQIVTPTVVQVARNQFLCQQLAGVPLENTPTSSSSCLGDHWEERYFATESLSSVFTGDVPSVLSPLTLALLEDSGWYYANFTMAKLSTFGHMAGCDFVTKPCLEDGTLPESSKGFFCNTAATAGCSPDLGWKQGCTLLQYNAELPVQYFDNPRIGGPLQSDFCPVFSSEYGDAAGNLLSTDCREQANTPSDNTFNEEFGPDSRCIITSINQGLCLQTECLKDEMVLRINVRGEWFTCDNDFAEIQVSISSLLQPITMTCPRLSQACPELFCPFNCAGKGICTSSQDTGRQTVACECFDPEDRSPGCTESSVLFPPEETPMPSIPSSLGRPTEAPSFLPSFIPSISQSEIGTYQPSQVPTSAHSATPSFSKTLPPALPDVVPVGYPDIDKPVLSPVVDDVSSGTEALERITALSSVLVLLSFLVRL